MEERGKLLSHMNLKTFKYSYDLLSSDKIRTSFLKIMETFNIPKDIVRLDTNDLCNIECIFCSNKPQKFTPDHLMSFQKFKVLIDKIHKTTRMLYLSCSYEPLMTPNFGEYIAYAKSKGIPFISFATNALLLDKNNLIHQLVNHQINELIISFNGFNRADYNRIMFRSSYDKVIKNLQELKEYKEIRGSTFPKIRLNTILLKSNIVNFDKIVKFIFDYNIDTVQYRPLITRDTPEPAANREKMNTLEQPQNNPDEINREKISNFSEEELEYILKDINSYSKKLSELGKRIIIPVDLLNKNKLTGRDKQPDSKTSCCIPFFCYWINYRGTVSVCCSDADSIIGNIFTDTMGKMKEKRNTFRKKALSGKCGMNCSTNIDSSTII